jgi:hypothetical protein
MWAAYGGMGAGMAVTVVRDSHSGVMTCKREKREEGVH